MATVSGICQALPVNSPRKKWIIDTGATNHMTSDISLLNKASIYELNSPNHVYLPITLVIAQYPAKTLTNVFHVPGFKYNLLSVSKITKELRCSIFFFPDFCIFQKLYNGRVREIGKKENGLYILLNESNKHPN